MFQVNDIVKGLPGSPYSITDERMTEGRVIDVKDEGVFTVKILAYPHRPSEIGAIYYNLDPKYFKLVRHEEPKPFNRLEAVAALAQDKSALLRYDLSNADLSDLNLSGSNLRSADLSGSNLRSADLSGSNLSGSNLSGSNLRSANLRSANLRSADLSGSNGLMSAIAFMDSYFERTSDGYIAYKTFGSCYTPNPKWKIEPGSIIEEVVNPDRTDDCGCGVNVAPLDWVKRYASNYGRRTIWKVLIRYEWLAGVVVPYGSDGKIRCEKVQLVESVNE